MTMELPKGYEPEDVEQRIYKLWEESGSFKADRPATPRPTPSSFPRPMSPGLCTWATP